MSLTDRVQPAGNADDAASQADSALLAQLRKQVHDVLFVDELAKLAQDNPERARNEVRSACRRIFEGPLWAYADADMRDLLVSQLLDALFGFGQRGHNREGWSFCGCRQEVERQVAEALASRQRSKAAAGSSRRPPCVWARFRAGIALSFPGGCYGFTKEMEE